jgi:non-homologous end joining protein Ku
VPTRLPQQPATISFGLVSVPVLLCAGPADTSVPSDAILGLGLFVPIGAVDPSLHTQAIALVPAEGGERAYALLHAALQSEKLVGIGQFEVGSDLRLFSLRVLGDVLVIEPLSYPEEIEHLALIVDKAPVTPRELRLARELVQQLSGSEFNPDEYPRRIPPRTEGAETIELLEALRAQLARISKNPVPASKDAGDPGASQAVRGQIAEPPALVGHEGLPPIRVRR